MTIDQIFAFNLALFAALLSPGPAMLVIVQTVVSAGRRAGAALGFGLALMAASWTLAALFGLHALFALFPTAYLTLKIAGALYLLYIAWKTWRAAAEPITAAPPRRSGAFWRGVLVNLLNPKSVLFAAAVLVVVFPQDMTMGDKLIVAANQLVVECLFYGGLVFCLSRAAVARRYLGAKRWLDRIAAGVLGLLGLRLLVSR